MKKKLPSRTRLKHFRNLFYSLCFLLLGINASWGQAQTIGSFPYMEGGFENYAASTIAGTLSASTWSVSSTTNSTTRAILSNAAVARTGSKYASHTTAATTVRLQSPTTATAANAPAPNVTHTVQYYYNTTTDQTTSLQGSVYNTVTDSKSGLVTSTYSSGIWVKATYTATINAAAAVASTNFAAVRHAAATTSNVLIDDFVVYAGTVDITAPTAATASTVSIASATTFNVGWTASADADKTGYMVVRYTSDPASQPLPNTNGIYGVGGTIGTGTVAYLGTGNSFIDTVTDTGLNHYYRIFTVDKAFNYSSALDLVTVVDNTAPGNPGAVTVGGATATTLAPSWEAAASIDGGGYLVVRYATSPNANNDPTQKATYVVGNTYTNGTGSLTGTVVYVGTGLITTDTGLTTGVTYYYKVYTFDQAKNYSGESSGSGTTTAAADNTAPNAPGTASISNQTTTTLTTNWLAASGGVDGGGYMVVRYSGDPTVETGANPVQKATYLVNDTYATGTNPDGITAPKTARVVYIGTDLTCITTGLTPSDYTYYKVYTFDAAKNYSDASFVKGKTSYQFVTPTALAATVPAADGFTANWNLLDSSLTTAASIYTVNTYTAAATSTTVVGWTIPATIADTSALIADITTDNSNNTAKTLSQNGGGSINTAVSGNTGFAARGSSYYSTNLVSGTEILTDDADPLLVAVYASPKAAPDKYWQVEVNTVGYINPTISSHQYSTATGPRDFKLQYSSTGTSGTFTDLVSTITLGSQIWNTTAVANVSLPASCQNNPNVVLRWVQTSFTNTNGVEMTTPATGGTSRIDNILVKGLKLTNVKTTVSSSSTNTFKAVSGLASGSYYYDVVASKNSTTDAVTGVVSSFVASPSSNLISVGVTTPQNVANYRSTASGTISSTSIWEYFDATAWQTATEAPTSTNNITIQAAHTVTLTSDFVLNTGKSLTISGTLDLAGFNVSGAGATVTSNSGSKVILGNNVSLASGITTATVALNTATNFDFNGTSVAQHTGGLPGSTLSTSNANGSQNYTTTLTGNITVSNPEGVTMNQAIKLNTPGTLRVTSTGKLLFGDGNVASGTIASGTYNSGSYSIASNSTGSFYAESGCTLVITASKGISGAADGNIRTATRTFESGINFVFAKNDGFNPISIGTSFYNGDINPATGIKNMTIDCPYGVYFASTFTGTANTNASGFVTTLTYTGGNDITVNGALNFVSGKLYTGDYVTVATNSVPAVVVNLVNYYPVVSLVTTPGNTSTLKLNVGASGSITGAASETGWVVGNLSKATAASASPSFTYAIGNATNYTPLALTFSGNTSAAGSLTASTASGDHAAIASSGIITDKSVNRTWTLTNDALAGFGTYSATFGYASTDNDAVTTPAYYITRLYNGSTWSAITSSGTSTDTAATATGISAFGNFAIGERATEIPTGPLSLCQGATVASVTGTTSLKFYADIKSTTAALVGTTAFATKSYFVTENIRGTETPRVSLSVIVNALPATPSALVLTNDNAVLPAISTTAVTALGLYAGTSTPFKLTATAVGAVSYKWTLPSGVVRTNSTGTTTDSEATSTDGFIYVKFTGTGSATPLVINVQTVNASGCTSAIKASASLTRLLPAAPGALAMNNGLNTTAITTFAKYMGSPTVLRLSATASVTATSYLWELPTGVNRMTALEGGSVTTDLTSTDPFIYVNFAGVTKDNTDTNPTVLTALTKVLRFGVKSVNGVGLSVTANATATNPSTSSTAKLLTLTAVAPAAPASLAMNNGLNTTAITVISKMIGQGATVKLLAPISVLASSYAWELPACVTRVTDLGGLTADNASTSIDPFIYVKFNGTNPAAGSIYFGVTAVNGIGSSVTNNSAATVIPSTSSTAKLLKLATAVPAAPASLAMNNGANTTAITVISKMIGQGATVKLLAATSALANSYAWELPSCVTRVTDLGGSTADNTSTSTDPFIFVKFTANATALPGSIYFGVTAVNGVGSIVINNSALVPATASTAKLLKLVTAVPAGPTTLVLNDMNSATPTTAVTVVSKYVGSSTTLKLTAAASVLANTYSWELPSCVTRVTDLAGSTADNSSTSTDPFIYVKFNGTTPAAGSIYFGVKAVNNVGSSITANTGATIARTDKLLTVTGGLPAVVSTVSGSLSVCNRSEGFSYTITAPVGATGYIITAPAGSVVSSTNGVASAASGSSTNNVLTTSDLTFKVVYNGTASFATTDKSLVIRSANAFGPCLTTKALSLTKQTTCTSLASIVRLAAPSVTENFDVIAYPNPSSDVFTLEVQSSGKTKATTGVQVYDMTGRLIEQRQVESNSVELGNNYPTGIYNVIVNQAENTKTLRVIKK